MLNNLISLDDFLLIIEKSRQGYGGRILRQLLNPFYRQRVEKAWAHTDAPLKNWTRLEAVQRRLNLLATGDPKCSIYEHVCEAHLKPRSNLRAISFGCGTGAHERRFARSGRFSRIEGIDISEKRIMEAREYAAGEGLENVLDYKVGDIRQFMPELPDYDAVIAVHALHHVTPLTPAVERIASWLKPDGILILRDYVGPARFQWSDRQVDAADDALSRIPERYRIRWGSGTVKTRVLRPGKLAVRIADPSEAAESDRILDELARHFTEIEYRDLGGTLLHLVLKDIAHNFSPEEEEAAKWLRFLFDREDELMASGELASDFVFAIYGPPKAEHPANIRRTHDS